MTRACDEFIIGKSYLIILKGIYSSIGGDNEDTFGFSTKTLELNEEDVSGAIIVYIGDDWCGEFKPKEAQNAE